VWPEGVNVETFSIHSNFLGYLASGQSKGIKKNRYISNSFQDHPTLYELYTRLGDLENFLKNNEFRYDTSKKRA
jgi:hypothetical protein